MFERAKSFIRFISGCILVQQKIKWLSIGSVFIGLLYSSFSYGNQHPVNLIVVTLDGVRWQEVFRGIDPELMQNSTLVERPLVLKERFWHEELDARRTSLMPFFWQTIANQGIVIGNRDAGSFMSVANEWHFSYPGYSEIFTGVSDDKINSNRKFPNANVSFIEYLNNQPQYKQSAIFGSWDVFPYIFNTKRSKLLVNAGFQSMNGIDSSEVALLNALQKEIPSPWHNVRLDAFTYRFAKAYLRQYKPRVMAIALGETDDFAHQGKYDQYIYALARSDDYIKDLWQTLQSMSQYRDNTFVIITTDHGRGEGPEQWKHHASKKATQGYLKSLADYQQGIVGAAHIWMAIIGPGLPARGLLKTATELKQNQIAATALMLLGENPKAFNLNAGDYIVDVIAK